MRKKRNLFDELMEGFDSLADRRAGKRTLTHAVKPEPVPEIRADELTKVREDMKLSRSLFEA
jgi:putative transcriptional regulator